MITPDEIAKKAVNLYPKFLKSWVGGEKEENFFPVRVRANLKLKQDDLPGNIRAIQHLEEKSKQQRGWGYTINWRTVARSPLIGSNRIPDRIEIETLDDLLRLVRRLKDFSATRYVVRRVRAELPELNAWLVENVRTLAKHTESIEGLLAVTKFFQQNPSPDCFARQIPVDVHTKFIEENEAVLRQWLEILLPASAIDVNENTFAGRFGLRDKQQHHALRVLDSQLLPELQLKFDQLSLPLRSLALLPVCETTVVIVENWIPLHTLPAMSRTLGIFGVGKAVTRLHPLDWLHENKIVYWGDLDADGFQILSSLRNLFPHLVSIMMDRATLESQNKHVGSGTGQALAEPLNLTEAEALAFRDCLNRNLRLEQERIPQGYVDQAFRERLAN